jgi:hypothetical protein
MKVDDTPFYVERMAKTSKICLANFQDICDLLDLGELRLALHVFWVGAFVYWTHVYTL